MKKKGQLIPFVFIVLVAGLALIGYVFYNLFYGRKYEVKVFRVRIIDTIRSLIEDFKKYLGLSLTYSSHQALREHGCVGGTIEVEDNEVVVTEWIANIPCKVPVDLSRDCLGLYTKYYLNIYSALFNTTLPIELSKTNFTKCVYDMEESGVLSGKYDEGNFFVNCTGAGIVTSTEKIQEYEKININDFLSRNRYWYMFRIFHEWANFNVYSPCICSKVGCACGSFSGEHACLSQCSNEAEECAEMALRDLQRRFDKYVKCEKRRICCVQGRGPPCLPPSSCLDWRTPSCSKLCEHECYEPPPPEKICPLNPHMIFQNKPAAEESENLNFYTLKFSSSLECYSDYWYEARLAAAYEFKCTDYKYYVPSRKGPVPLVFAVSAYAFWRDQDACRTTLKCDCPEDAASCAECAGYCTPCG